MTNNNKYLYIITYHRIYEELCEIEMKYIFSKTASTNYHFSNDDIPVSRSTFIKGRIKIMYTGDSINDIENKMINDNLEFNDYKIKFIKYDEVSYQVRLSSMRKLGFTIEGDFAIKNAKVNFALTKINNLWIFGLYEENTQEWLNRKQKPFNYSNALEVRLAKAVVNIAINNDFSLKLVDPCCGIGTILIEALAMGINIKGYEINHFIKRNANANLEHFGFDPITTKMDMHNIDEHFDVAILDLPYGQFSTTTKEEQTLLLKKTKQISNKAVIITMIDMSDTLISLGYKIIDTCRIEKSLAFSRYITICE